MEKDDLKAFYKMCGHVEATHSTVKEIKEDLKEGDARMDGHHDRLTSLENRNKNIKENWKKAGWATGGIGAFVGGIKAFFSFFV